MHHDEVNIQYYVYDIDTFQLYEKSFVVELTLIRFLMAYP